ncbi:MAG: hypothetical protein KatS3mg030_588 [Saprospiraceae bacterium]|nr:MAG: hypothetical protein KatS3mg030_588 [Saprospiraceae bacterium]
MNIRLRPFYGVLVLAVLLTFTFVENLPSTEPTPEPSLVPSRPPTSMVLKVDRYGKVRHAARKEQVYTLTPWKEIGFPELTNELEIALKNQLRLLEMSSLKDGTAAGNLRLTHDQLRETIEIILARIKDDPSLVSQYLEAWQVNGADGRGNVYFTGYFTPVLEVSSKRTPKYRYPIYAYPADLAKQGRLPSRAEIDGLGLLEGKGLELAWASNRLDIYIMQLQGSGYVRFVDTGEQMLFSYAGENGHPYRNIQRFFTKRDDLSLNNLSLTGMGRWMRENPHLADSVLFYNPSYTFFKANKGLVKGSGQVPLMEDISVAADARYFPPGSVLLAAFPVIDNGAVVRHEFRLLLPQDVGGAIRGKGHLDVYCGIGKQAQKKASGLHHYGQVWLLLPKDDEEVAMLR